MASGNPEGGRVVTGRRADHREVGTNLRDFISEPEGFGPKSLFFKSKGLYLYRSDILQFDSIPDGSLDLTVTSPPYNVDISYKGYKDNLPYAAYLEFSAGWLSRCLALTRPTGRLCLNVPLDKNKGGQQSVYADLTSIAKRIGWKYHSTIIWNEQNISRRTAWGSWMSASAPFVIAPVETIGVFYKEEWKREGGSGVSDVTRDEFLQWTNAMWTFGGESATRIGHPAPFPLELPTRCIKLFSFVGDRVFDPFCGSGSTLVSCLQTGRLGIGVEMEDSYCRLIVDRIKASGLYQTKFE